MVEIEFSVMENVAGDAEQLLPLAKSFEKQYHIHVNLTGITWENGWNEIVKFGIYGHGPDVSSIGTSWIGSLASMRALRPFTPIEIQSLGGEDVFFKSAWNSGYLLNDPTLWTVPWFGDAMLIYFWENKLQEAGIDDFKAAFSNDAALLKTLKILQSYGIAHPLVINVKRTTMVLHEVAHWLWNAGGDFVNKNGSQVIFNQPPALDGFRNYFRLQPFISPLLLNAGTDDLFNTGESVIHFAGPWLSLSLKDHQLRSGFRPGVTSVPGVAFTGGSSLAIWQYTLHPRESFEWIRFLTSQPINGPSTIYRDQVPARREALQVPLLENDFSHRTYAQYLQSMQHGNSFPTMRLWGAIESHLVQEISKIWAALFADPNQDLDACIHRHLDPLARRLNLMLENQ